MVLSAAAIFFLAVFGLAFGVALIWVGFRVFVAVARGIGWCFRAVFALIRHVVVHLALIVRDLVRGIGSLVAALFLPVAAVASVGRGRWSAGKHYGRAFTDELENAAAALYRVALGHPLRLVGLGGLLEGVERRIPEVVAAAPGPDRPAGGPKRAFDGYIIEGSLPAGGSGARLWLARPTEEKRLQLAGLVGAVPDRVVIKAFDLSHGSTLPQIVRENRALEAARRMGLVLEHQMATDRFHYVMPFVPGGDLSEEARRLHGRASPEGLADPELRRVVDHACGLLAILSRFHRAGLWHKDIKPSNVIVGDGHVELVDLGLVTPLASAMTLTTHGTEYYRDPEMVRLAMRGVKVHEVDGVKFDLYSAGAVLYFLVEHSFPAHGSLSSITKRCPEALRWIVRRSMASLESRYATADEMLADLAVVRAAADPFALRPADLPSMGGESPVVLPDLPRPDHVHRAAPIRRPEPVHVAPVGATGAARRSRGGTFGLAVSIGLFLAAITVAGFSTFLVSSLEMHDAPRPRPIDDASGPRAGTETRDDVAAAHAIAGAARPRMLELARSGTALGRWTLDRAGRNTVAGEHARALAPRLDGLRILLLPAGAVAPSSDTVESFIDRIEEVPGLRLIDAHDDAQLDVIAGARTAVGLAGIEDAAARDRLLAFVRESDLVDAVVWYAVDAGARRVDHQLVVADRGHDSLAPLLDLVWAADAVEGSAPKAERTASVRVSIGGR